ncbi:MAG: tRNA lysidine(34) synthetase TilS [Pirellulaceae bacterium]|nr:tRNA lysidine(34) synthetase TilS [Pirellulaceae bacterium]
MNHSLEASLARDWPTSQWQDVTVLVAVSGGPDSVALLRAVQALKTAGKGQLVVGHFNHRWRPVADADATFVQELAGQLQLSCLVGNADEGQPRNEETARDQRYDFLLESARETGARFVVFAHTADDQVETILHRIMRGTGLAGLAGMPRVRQLDHGVALLRPLLRCHRSDVIDYLESLKQPFRRDNTNQDLQYTRNRIREQLLPQLKQEFNEGVADALLRLGDRAAEVQQVLELLTADLMEQSVEFQQDDQQQQVRIDCLALVTDQQLLLRELFVAIWKRQSWPRQSMGSEQWQRLADMVREVAGSDVQSLPGSVRAKKEGESLWLTRPRENH